MKKLYAFILAGVSLAAVAQQGAPASPYYNGFNWTLTGTQLRNALATLTQNKHTNNLTYSQVWDALQQTDQDPSNSNNVLLIYGWENGSDSNVTNDRSRGKFNNGGSNGEWNREHTFPQGLGNPELGQSGPGADAHHLRACDVQRNNSRGNLKFTDGSGIASGATNGGWYPGEEWKGDVARMVMYMYLRYGNQCLPTLVGLGPTAATDSNLPQIFLQWNAEDPVSQYEDNRNTYLGTTANPYGQGNRNPFIDNPYLATMIWGGPAAQNRWPTLDAQDFQWTMSVSVWPNPSQGNVNISSEVEIDRIEVISVNGQVIHRIEQPVFQANQYRVDGLPSGFYLIRLDAAGSSTVKKVIVN